MRRSFLHTQIKISILVITKHWNQNESHFSYLKELKQTNIDFEILLAEGNNPSTQRNRLAEKAEGDFLLFLDNDSVPTDDLLEIYLSTIVLFPKVEIVGGPSLLINNQKSSDQLLYNLSYIFFSSSFGIGPIKSRYNSQGVLRKASERELILCNLLIKRPFFLRTSGFNQNLYPGEENEFLKKLDTEALIIHNPNAIVYREPRESLFLFFKQMISYGKGRSKHLKWDYPYDYLFLVPLVFLFYVLIIPLVTKQTLFLYIPLLLHFILSLVTLGTCKSPGIKNYHKVFLPLFFLFGHLSYGGGLLVGLVKYKLLAFLPEKEKGNEKIQIHKLKKFEKNPTFSNCSIK